MKKSSFKFVLCMIALCVIGSFSFALGAADSQNTSGGKVNIVTTIFPEYDWVKNILGDETSNVNLTLLMNNGVDPHSFQPSVADIAKISSCDVFIYVGGESDGWAKDAIKNSRNPNLIAINLLEVLGDKIKAEELVEGMQGEDEHEHADHHDEATHDGHEAGEHHDHHEHEEVEYDEHVWLSLKNAIIICNEIAKTLAKADSNNAKVYEANAASYIAKLSALDAQYKDAVKTAKTKTVLFGDRFPFRYLVDDYGIKYYAAFVGCSAETEASFETVLFLSKKVDELKLGSVLTIEGANHKIAQTIVNDTKSKSQKVLTMDSMQAVTSKDVQSGKTYLSIMESNLAVLKAALN